MHYLIVSLSHKNSDLELREKFTYTDEEKEACLQRLLKSPNISEAVMLATCNRMELYVCCSDIEEATEHMMKLLAFKGGLPEEVLRKTAEIVDDSSAIHHLFAVASSIDSMVVGETQIAGQLKDAFKFSNERGYSDKKMSRALSHAFKCAAKVRNLTDISSKPVSVASVAIKQIKEKVQNLREKKALVIGVGEMSEICAKHLVSDGVETFIANRTKQKAQTLAQECNAKVYEFGDLDKAVNEFDIIFTATASSYPIITNELIEDVDFERFWFDLAVPRDIDIKNRENIFLFVVDDIKDIVDANKAQREQYVRQAHGIVGRSVVEFYEWLDTLNVEPIIKEIYKKAEKAAQEETQRAVKKGFLPQEYEKQAQKMAHQAIKRFLHDMTKKMRAASHEAKSDSVTGAMQYILNDEHDNIPDQYKHHLKKD
ncbi:glutamyl-tRNA reductase [Sulfurimonas sediminis]|uniref:Glutamyl-tRNA reductase n=1 Tax=Sulfurimonas sediminis TaxID=2590020 RepID=A0A7M1B571_9BACT|nr:glutamyl-tRNA reductase [Sulfurimonas sediminis]QOP43888.1 glutamyl-tRNA reductase [Sulfurimonas sediminis]